MSKFYCLEKPRHAWGDYYDILMHGMSSRSDPEGAVLQLKRTGPFVPPVSLPGGGDIIVTDAFRRELETSGLEGLRFQPVMKKLIARYNWDAWDRDAKEPVKYPRGGEPENYILGKRHNAAAAEQMGELWEVLLGETARVHRVGSTGACDIYLLTDSWRGEDLFHAQGVGYIYATERAKGWLEEHAKECVAFREASTKDTI